RVQRQPDPALLSARPRRGHAADPNGHDHPAARPNRTRRAWRRGIGGIAAAGATRGAFNRYRASVGSCRPALSAAEAAMRWALEKNSRWISTTTTARLAAMAAQSAMNQATVATEK